MAPRVRVTLIGPVTPLLSKHLMNKGDGDRAFSDCGRDALDVAAAHVSDGEDAGTARLEKVWRAPDRPLRGRKLLGREIGTGLDKAFVIDRNTPCEPASVWDRAGHHEDV